jgi:hypothetical protein
VKVLLWLAQATLDVPANCVVNTLMRLI